ncbi:FkbM family methyltransferase [Hyphomonas sp.]|uniref:FkbM family methyltransferase n=1 Tax=Hyphomonas sp. TaxID=87 RepID=UPI003D2BE13B|tara:strand:- start:1737 stop:8624 length:6888 start_codon:yes stop_codon:yes gene_type:complete
MKSLVLLSNASSNSDLDGLIARASWYLWPFASQIAKITIITQNYEEVSEFQLPEIFDSALSAHVSELLPKFCTVAWSGLSDPQKSAVISNIDGVFLASKVGWISRDKDIAATISAAKSKGLFFEVDPEHTRMEGSFYLWAGLKLFGDANKITEQNYERFTKFRASLPPKNRAYVFGTGPSLSDFAASHNFDDGHCVVSNSMVKNAELLRKLKPVAIVAADPIFHAGCSRYAAAFRSELIGAMRATGCYFITSLRDYSIFHAFLPADLRDRLISVPFDSTNGFNPDLAAQFSVQPLANILTLLLLPLAGAIAEEICVVGCDGRPIDENTYFWGHDKSAQFNEEMDNIKLVHPAFFAVDYSDYYSEHCANVSIAIDALQSRNKKVLSLTPSYIPALANLGSIGDFVAAAADNDSGLASDNAPHIVLIDPDGKNASGHFLAYDRRIWETANENGQQVTLLSRLDLDQSAAPIDLVIKKCFSVHSWEIGTRNDGTRATLTDKFITELRNGLNQIPRSSRRATILYLYCGSLEHTFAIHKVLQDFPNVSAHINLFWQSNTKYEPAAYLNRWRPQIAKFASSDQIHLSVPTETVARQMEAHFGLNLSVAPHPSTTFSDAAARRLALSPVRQLNTKPKVLFPGGVRMEKGFGLTVEVAELLKTDLDLSICVRSNADNSSSIARELVEKLKGTGVETSDGYLTDDAFSEFLAKGDIIVCPYLASHFAARTSGLVIDAMILGRPVVALKNTWLGEFTERNKIGIAADPNAASIAAAIRKVAKNYDSFARSAAKARNAYLDTNCWTRLLTTISVDTLRHCSHDARVGPGRTKAELDAAISNLPSNLRSAIFLPTDRMSLTEKADGIEKVVELYSGSLTKKYVPKLRALKERRKRKRCFIIGNGPSLKNTDLSFLNREDTFVTNGFFLKLPDLGWAPTYYVVEDHLVAEDRAHEINLLRGFTKLFPASLRYVLTPDSDTVYFDHRPRKSFPHGFDFSFDADENTYAGGTVTFTCMELAAYLGYEEIYLIGVDADYAIPKDAEVSGGGRVKELDMASDDPNHFHPDYFGKGKRWHEPNVDVMIQAYQEAKRACDARGLRIINATVGGRLEVFPRVSYNSLFEIYPPTIRTLLLDMTRCGDATATGELKASLFEGWPRDQLLQIFDGGEGKLGLYLDGETIVFDEPSGQDKITIDSAVAAFQPQVVLYRPTPKTDVLHTVAMRLIEQLDLPLVTWIMDDWPQAYIRENPKKGEALDADWRKLVKQSSVRLSISAAMSDAFSERYGLPFTPIANGINPADWKRASPPEPKTSFKIRYAGSLAENMTLDSVKLTAQAVEELVSEGVSISFEIKTRERFRATAQNNFRNFPNTSFVVANLSAAEYRNWLSGADIVLIAYNFDEASKAYTRYSLANKLPECLASGSALLAVGPEDVATISTLREIDCGERVVVNSLEEVTAALHRLAGSAERRYSLAEKAQKVAAEEFNIEAARRLLAKEITRASSRLASAEVSGKPRSAGAHVDETAVVARILTNRRGRDHVMLDVGAHYGTSASYFHKLNWSIHCFEPDESNRQKLQAKLGTAEGVTIDTRAVSDKPATGVSFFTSKESTGISGLLAFRDTHTASSKVDITTVAEIVSARQLSRIDFLKIDVEGYDLNVLKGVPWDQLKPDVIECEFEDAKTLKLGHTWKDIAEYLRTRGYTIYISEWHPIVRYGIPHQWRRVVPYPGETMSSKSWGNILAFRIDPGYGAVSKAFDDLVAFRQPTSPSPQAGIQIKAESINPMLMKTPPSAIPTQDPQVQKSQWYKELALKIHNVSPKLYSIVRFMRRAGVHIFSRRILLLPVAIVAVLIAFALFLPSLAPYRPWILVSACAGLLAALLGYIAFRSHAHLEALHHQVATLNQETSKLRTQVVTAQTLLSLNARNAAKTTAELVHTTLAQTVSPRLDAVLSGSNADRRRIDTLDTKMTAINGRLSTLDSKVSAVDGKISAIDTVTKKSVEAAATLQKTLTSKVDTITASVKYSSDKTAQTDKWSQFNNATWFQFFNRRLSADHIAVLETEWRKRLSVPVSRAILGYMANRACEIENQLAGRLATSIEDILLRSLVARAVKGSRINVLEIGTLFGTGAAIMFDALANHYEEIHFTLLDPLEGYYSSTQADILTGQPIDERTLKRNLDRVGMREDQYTLIKNLSTELEAIEAAGARQYDVLVIDADHSYAGVKTDFENYAQFVKLGGYIIFDDYSSPDWPDVQAYVDSELAHIDYISLVGATWRTCVFRVVKSPGANSKSSATTKPRTRKAAPDQKADPSTPD